MSLPYSVKRLKTPQFHGAHQPQPPQLSFSHDGRERRQDPEHLTRLDLFFRAIKGDTTAIETLKDTYHLTHLVLDRRIIIKNNARNGTNGRPVPSTPTRRSPRSSANAR